MTQSKAEITNVLKERKWILKILENSIKRSDFRRDNDYCKALLKRMRQIIDQLEDIRQNIAKESNSDLLKKADKLIDYYHDFIEQKAEDWGKLTN